MATIIMPKIYVPLTKPFIFLGGPIRGAPRWHDEAISLLIKEEPNIILANPSRTLAPHLQHYQAHGDASYFVRQRAWERHYLTVGAVKGTIMFWLPGEKEHKCDKSYGAMTRLELGQLMTRYKYDKTIDICIGSDGKFSELDTIMYDLSLDMPHHTLHQTLEATCKAALALARQKTVEKYP